MLGHCGSSVFSLKVKVEGNKVYVAAKASLDLAQFEILLIEKLFSKFHGLLSN